MTAWNVYLNGAKINTVWYNSSLDSEYVRTSLINHDNYDDRITVRKSNVH